MSDVKKKVEHRPEWEPDCQGKRDYDNEIGVNNA